MPSDDPLQEIGRGVARIHMKLTRIQEALERPPERPTDPPREDGSSGHLDALLDLVDAVESALARRAQEAGGARGWFRRGRARGDDLWRGLAVAVGEARDRLARQGIEPAPEQGAFDPSVHQAVEVVTNGAGREEGTLAATHRRGWLRREGAERVVLRTAQVSVHGGER